MKHQPVLVNELHVNRFNDRHGEQQSEEDAIAWLLEHRGAHMRKLAEDIASAGKIYEPPLVHSENGQLVVDDGNRRVACLKLLNNPTLATTPDWQKFFKGLSTTHAIPSKIQCRIETNVDEIDEILYRRHTGTQQGVGQSQWDDTAKSNFIERTGKKAKVKLGEEIVKKLVSENLIKEDKRIPRSNLSRLLSGRYQRTRVGISVEKNKVYFTHLPHVSLAALTKIVEDMRNGKPVLGDIWAAEGKRKYLNSLEMMGVLPNAHHALDEPLEFHKTSKDWEKPSNEPIPAGTLDKPEFPDVKTTLKDIPELGGPAEEESNRPTLIPTGYDYRIPKKPELKRVRAIWEELEQHLTFGTHTNAIAVLFRVLLEQAINHYVETTKIQTHQNDKLRNKYLKCLDQQLKDQILSKTDLAELRKFEKAEPVISSHTMHAYVHSTNFSPSPEHLRPMWDTLQKFILNCLKSSV